MSGGIIRSRFSHFMSFLKLFKPISTFVFDIDGVLTDGGLLILNDGQQARMMNIKDGYAMQLAVKQGYRIVIISGSHSDAVKERLCKLGVVECYMNVHDKKAKLLEIITQYGLDKQEILYMGDDIPDLAAMQLVGLSCCPADAVEEIKQSAQYISPFAGGKACVRDVIEKVLKLRGEWFEV